MPYILLCVFFLYIILYSTVCWSFGWGRGGLGVCVCVPWRRLFWVTTHASYGKMTLYRIIHNPLFESNVAQGGTVVVVRLPVWTLNTWARRHQIQCNSNTDTPNTNTQHHRRHHGHLTTTNNTTLFFCFAGRTAWASLRPRNPSRLSSSWHWLHRVPKKGVCGVHVWRGGSCRKWLGEWVPCCCLHHFVWLVWRAVPCWVIWCGEAYACASGGQNFSLYIWAAVLDGKRERERWGGGGFPSSCWRMLIDLVGWSIGRRQEYRYYRNT